MKTNLKILIPTAFCLVASIVLFAFKATNENKKVIYMQITAVETQHSENSTLIVTKEDGGSQEFTFGGWVDVGDLEKNSQTIDTKLSEYCSNGWILDKITSNSEAGGQRNITPYLLKKEM